MTETRSSTDDISAWLQRWTATELQGDTEAMNDLLTPDFIGVGPLGFVLTRADWLERHRGGLAYSRYNYDEVTVQHHAGCAVVIARQDAEGTWQGHPVPGTVRVSLVLVPAEHGWQVTYTQTSFIAGTPGAPPIPGRPAGGENS